MGARVPSLTSPVLSHPQPAASGSHEPPAEPLEQPPHRSSLALLGFPALPGRCPSPVGDLAAPAPSLSHPFQGKDRICSVRGLQMRLRAGLFPGLLRLLPHLGGHCSLASVSAPLPPGSLGGRGAGSGRRTALVLQLNLDFKEGVCVGGCDSRCNLLPANYIPSANYSPPVNLLVVSEDPGLQQGAGLGCDRCLVTASASLMCFQG